MKPVVQWSGRGQHGHSPSARGTDHSSDPGTPTALPAPPQLCSSPVPGRPAEMKLSAAVLLALVVLCATLAAVSLTESGRMGLFARPHILFSGRLEGILIVMASSTVTVIRTIPRKIKEFLRQLVF